MKLQRVN